MRRRSVLLLCALATLAAGLAVHTVGEGEIAGYTGDALYATLVCFLVAAAFPRLGPWRAAAVAAALSWGVEFLQLAPWVGELSAHSTAARLVLGTTFNAPDLALYVIGAVAGGGVQAVLWRRAPQSGP
ncbi:ribosomal maturation YjgA family protein [Actinocorallia aurea]